MKKNNILILAFFLLLGCGRYKVETDLGGLKSTNPVVVDGENLNRIKSICDALEDKNPSSLVNSIVNFDYSKRDCGQESLSTPTVISTTIINFMDHYKFTQSNAIFPYFSDIETLQKGMMVAICNKIKTSQTLESPIKENGSYLYFSALSVSAAACNPLANQVCILLERGSESSEGLVQVHTKDWIRFDLNKSQGRGGFFTLRRQITSGGCPEGETQENLAQLK
jgi:hypothetical protein